MPELRWDGEPEGAAAFAKALENEPICQRLVECELFTPANVVKILGEATVMFYEWDVTVSQFCLAAKRLLEEEDGD